MLSGGAQSCSLRYKNEKVKIFFFSFTLYHTPLPTFCRILEALRVEWQNVTPRFTSTLGIEPTTSQFLQSQLVPLRHDWPLIISFPVIVIEPVTVARHEILIIVLLFLNKCFNQNY